MAVSVGWNWFGFSFLISILFGINRKIEREVRVGRISLCLNCNYLNEVYTKTTPMLVIFINIKPLLFYQKPHTKNTKLFFNVYLHFKLTFFDNFENVVSGIISRVRRGANEFRGKLFCCF